jgi:hypothetical protein
MFGNAIRSHATVKALLCGALLTLSFVGFAWAQAPADPLARRETVNLISGGQKLALGMTQVVGVSVSPLFGITGLGAYGYYKAPQPQRADLPWFNQPAFWGPAVLLLLVIMFKDVLTTAFPPLQALKKPLDALENLENMLSGLIAMPIVIFLLLNLDSQLIERLSAKVFADQTVAAQTMFSAGGPGVLGGSILAVVAAVGYALVWLASHTINVLILLSPFGAVDLALRGFRLFLIGLIAAAAAIHPYLGLLVCLVLVFIAWRMCGWSFRLLVFGWVFSFDLLGRRRRTERLATAREGAVEIHAFSSAAFRSVPPRTYGRLRLAPSGALEFVYCPWLVQSERSLAVEIAPAGAAIGRGLLSPVLQSNAGPKAAPKTLFRLPPRYGTHEHAVADALGIADVRDIGLARGLRAMRQWISDSLRARKASTSNG